MLEDYYVSRVLHCRTVFGVGDDWKRLALQKLVLDDLPGLSKDFVFVERSPSVVYDFLQRRLESELIAIGAFATDEESTSLNLVCSSVDGRSFDAGFPPKPRPHISGARCSRLAHAGQELRFSSFDATACPSGLLG